MRDPALYKARFNSLRDPYALRNPISKQHLKLAFRIAVALGRRLLHDGEGPVHH